MEKESCIDEQERIRRAKEMMAPKGYEERIAVMVCKKAADGCTGSSCFWAFQEKFRSFEQYKGRPAKLWAFFHCGGCDADRKKDPGLQKKMKRLKEDGVYKVHLGVCIRNNCTQKEELCQMLEEYGLPWEMGTH